MQLNIAKFGNDVKAEAIATTEFDLHKAGFTWITNNNGVHLQIVFEDKIIADYWPTTERFKFRKCSNAARLALVNVVKHKHQKVTK